MTAAAFGFPEWLSLAFFLFFSILAWLRPIDRGRQLKATALGVLGIALLLALPATSNHGVTLQRILPLVLIPLAYWQTGQFSAPIHQGLQTALAAMDRRIVQALEKIGIARRRLPQLDAIFEYAYLFVYPMVPSGLAVLYFAGEIGHAQEFWTVILPPAYLCYATLPFVRTLPPRLLEKPEAQDAQRTHIRAFNLVVVRLITHQSNTFPSGHAVAAVAVALELIRWVPVAGILYALLAMGIMAGAFLGRYHYAADVLIGGAIAALSFIVVIFVQ
jgi:membrane-associated phospholipid phosphatase